MRSRVRPIGRVILRPSTDLMFIVLNMTHLLLIRSFVFEYDSAQMLLERCLGLVNGHLWKILSDNNVTTNHSTITTTIIVYKYYNTAWYYNTISIIPVLLLLRYKL